MGTTPVSGATGSSTPTSSSSAGFNVTGQQFLQLLVAQLKYQNPMQPLDSSKFLTQLATLEQVQLLQSIQSELSQLVKQGTPSTGAPQG